MRVAALFRFYFPYVLPRAGDWEGEALKVEYPGFDVRLRARGKDEGLFPDEIDRALARLTFPESTGPVPGADGPLQVRAVCRDRVEVAVVGELDSVGEAQKQEVQERYRWAAIYACDGFLHYCRVALGHPFVRGLEVHFDMDKERYVLLTPYSESWGSAEDGDPLAVFASGANTRCKAAMLSPDLGSVSMQLIKEVVQDGARVNLARSLLVDAEERIVVGRLYQGILGLAIACELASEDYMRRKGKRTDPSVEKELSCRDHSFAERRFHYVPLLADERSLKDEDPGTFEGVEDMYRTRNAIMHEGQLGYRDEGRWVQVNQLRAVEFLSASREGIAWIGAL